MGVVAIHTMILNFDAHSLGGILLAVFRNLLGCCVPFFIAASGYFLCNKEVSTKTAYFSFIRTRLKVVYIPLLIWGLPWLLLNLISVRSIIGVGYAFVMYFIGGFSVLYFIILIIELYALLPIIQKIRQDFVVILSIISIAVTFGWSLINYTTDIHPPLILYCSFPTYIGYFALGCYLGKNNISPNLLFSVSITIIGMLLAVMESYYWLDYNPQNNWLGLKASVQLLAYGIILFLFNKQWSNNYKSTWLKKIIEWLGNQSMPIYMTHILIIFALGMSGFTPSLWITKWIVVLGIDVLFIFLLSKLLPKNILLYLGIR